MLRAAAALVMALSGLFLILHTIPTGGQEEGAEDEVRVFDADLGPAFIDVSSYPPEYQTLYPVFAQKCSKCHTLARPINSSKTGDEWRAYVSRMSRKPSSGISPNTAESIFKFLSYDSQVRARSSNAIDPTILPFLKVSEELSGIRRIAAANKNVPVETETLRLQVQGDRRLNVKRFFAGDEGQRMVRWTQRDPGRGELIVQSVDALEGGPPEAANDPPDGPVAEAAADAVGSESDPEEKVELILDWIDESIERTFQPGTGTAEAALAKGQGDATEFTRLFCEMAKAVGIATRTRVGLVAQRTSFHFHAWAEAWLGGWIPVDPYLGQFPADITHIRLASDEEDGLAAWDPGHYPGLERLRLAVVVEEDDDESNAETGSDD